MMGESLSAIKCLKHAGTPADEASGNTDMSYSTASTGFLTSNSIYVVSQLIKSLAKGA